ncbi:MAG: metalloregulator ArsR/SmtB family transcription factor, partial [Dehalococcoidia bacterium]
MKESHKQRDQLTGVWRALADPTRRQILDLLRERPRMTGELCEAFPLSRYAVMKHLDVLEEVGLIAVRRRGRERWNYLNAVPLQQIYERWLRPYEAQWAGALLRLGEAARRRKEDEMTIDTGVRQLDVQMDLRVDAPPETVFRALVEDIDAWWGAPHLHAPSARGIRLELEPGGRLWEDWGDGQGAVWGRIHTWRRNERLELVGPFGMVGPVQGLVRFHLDRDGSGTLLRFSHQAVGAISDADLAAYS